MHAAAFGSRLPEDLNDQQTCPQQSALVLFNWCYVMILDEVCNFALRFEKRFGRAITRLRRVGVLLHEQRTGWSSRLGIARRWRAGGLFTIITRLRWRHGEWQRPRPIRTPLGHQQHAIFGKWLHHRGATVHCGGRDFRRISQFVVQKQDNELTGFHSEDWELKCY